MPGVDGSGSEWIDALRAFGFGHYCGIETSSSLRLPATFFGDEVAAGCGSIDLHRTRSNQSRHSIHPSITQIGTLNRGGNRRAGSTSCSGLD